MLYLSYGIERPYSKAIKCIKLSFNVFDLDDFMEYHYSEAHKYFKMYMELSNSNAMNLYLIMLQNGEGVNGDNSDIINSPKLLTCLLTLNLPGALHNTIYFRGV